MARKDVEEYFLIMKDQYFEMVDDVKELDALLAENRISNENYNAAIKDIEIIKSNYDRLAYIMWLLNKPDENEILPDDIQYPEFEGDETSTEEYVKNENKLAKADMDVLKAQGDINE